MTTSFIILDRDGVINYDSESYIKSPEEWQPIPGSLESIAALNQAGFQVAVVTNQSGVARGLYDLLTLNKIHDKLIQNLAKVGGKLAEIIFCPHHPKDNCECRKPKPGMLYQVQNKFNIDLSQVTYIGDSLVDIQAARAAGCNPLLVLTGNGKKTVGENPDLQINSFADLSSAVKHVLQGEK